MRRRTEVPNDAERAAPPHITPQQWPTITCKMRRCLLLAALQCSLCAAAAPHPRIFLNDSALADITGKLAVDPVIQSYLTQVISRGITAAARPPTPLPNCTAVGLCRDTSRYGPGASYLDAGGAGAIIIYGAVLHRLNVSNASAFGARARSELLHVCTNFSTWYWPIGEALERSAMAYAVAIGYDLLYNELTVDQRVRVEDVLGSLALDTRLADGREGLWWLSDAGNWAINGNAPLISAALVLADVPKWALPAARVIAAISVDMAPAVGLYDPDGLWAEGPTYGMFSQQWLAQGCEGATGSLVLEATRRTVDGRGIIARGDVGPACSWAVSNGLCASGHSTLQMLGPSGNTFNFGDAHEEGPYTSVLFHASSRCSAEREYYAAAARSLRAGGGATYLDLLWYSERGTLAQLEQALPLAAVFADASNRPFAGVKTHMGSFRSAWTWISGNASAAVWIAFKGGSNAFPSGSSNNHGHLDVGSWVFEAHAFRWIIELGPDAYDYPLLSYFGRFRWGYYVPSSTGHNVLRIGTDTQHRLGSGAIVAFTAGTSPSATIDATTAYGGTVNVTRTFALSPAADTACAVVTITDTWQLPLDYYPPDAIVTWQIHTLANATVLPDPTAAAVALVAEVRPGVLKEVLLTASVLPDFFVQWEVTALPALSPEAAAWRDSVRVVRASVPTAAGWISVAVDPCPKARGVRS